MTGSSRVAALPALALAFLVASTAIMGSVAPAEDPLSGWLASDPAGSMAFGSIGGSKVSGPISIRDSIIGDIISINVKVTGRSTARTNVSLELVHVLVCALNAYGDYGIEMADVRLALAQYVSRHGADGGKS